MAKKERVWTNKGRVASVNIKGRQFRGLIEWEGTCDVCGRLYTCYNPGKQDAPPTRANCDDHIGLTPAIENGWLRWDGSKIVAGPKCGGVAGGDVQALREEIATGERAIKECWDIINEERAENAILKAKLSQYELHGAVQQLQTKMPWQT